MTQLTTKQAWEKIAAAFELYVATGRKVELTKYGLCYAAGVLRDRGEITWDQYTAMDNEMRDQLDDRNSGLAWCDTDVWLWPTNIMGARHRAILAQLIAEALD